MVFLVLTPAGLEDALRLRSLSNENVAIWCGADAITEEQFHSRKLPEVTRFIYSPGATGQQSIADALDTIDQHHSGERVWVEGRCEA